MVAYRTSDVKLDWRQHHVDGTDIQGPPITCGYVKEGLGELSATHLPILPDMKSIHILQIAMSF